jgi:NAD+ dependent glucose-6-phosphate dehydrogenase
VDAVSAVETRTLLITGASGSIGSKLRAHFLARGGYSLRLLCINPANDPTIFTADLARYDEVWARQFENVDAVIHLAGASSTTSTWDAVQALNIDLSLNVLRAAERHGARRIVFASSNWVVAGHRFANLPLTADMPPAPVNPYGSAKLFIERAGRDWAARTGRCFVALRIGYCQHSPGNIPGPHMEHGVWGQQMWLSDRDLCQAVERAAVATGLPFTVLNVMSANPGMRWDIESTRRSIGYQPEDGHTAVSTPTGEEQDRTARASQEVIEHLQSLAAKW